MSPKFLRGVKAAPLFSIAFDWILLWLLLQTLSSVVRNTVVKLAERDLRRSQCLPLTGSGGFFFIRTVGHLG